MAGSTGLLKGPTMDWSSNEGLYSRYKLWKQQCELLFTGPLVKVEEKIQCKYLMYWAGERGLELFNSWGLSADAEKSLKSYWTNFENALKPQSNELMSAWELHELKQGTMSIEEFITKIRNHIKEANYPADLHERFLRDHFVFGINSSRVRKECLKEGNSLTFNRAKDLAKSEESAERQLKIMGQGEVHTIRKHGKQGKPVVSQYKAEKSTQPTFHRQSSDKETVHSTCLGCGKNTHPRSKCPAKDVTCHYCHRKGHYAKVCMKKNKKVNELAAELPDNIDDVLFLGPVTTTPTNYDNINMIASKEKALLEVKISASEKGVQNQVVCKIDSGAETNILPRSLYDKLQPHPSLRKSTVKLSAYGGTNIPTVGSCDVYVQAPASPKPHRIKVQVTDADGPAIIGNITAQKLGLLKLNWSVKSDSSECTPNTQRKQHPYPITKEYLLKEYTDVFTAV
ncbi:hypothetical protein AC249_AIPGENE17533 [Exaiptasia diaphana]|nr:hypothetical protein AC249_AIPGENE17533 [Exaiptasia diaphana]